MGQSYNRARINGTTPQDLMHINDNFAYLWMKTFGDINNADISDSADITGGKLKAGTITAREIATDYLYAGKIDAKQINVGILDGFTLIGSSLMTKNIGNGEISLANNRMDFYNGNADLVGNIDADTSRINANGAWNFAGTLMQGGNIVLTSSNWSNYVTAPSGDYLPSTGSTITLNGHTLAFYSDGITYDGHTLQMNA